MIIKTVIVDDEPPICDELEYLLTQHQDINVVAKFNQAFDALAYIVEHRPHLAFLDINMPGISGLELAEKLKAFRDPPLIVITTAYPEHALAAFDTPAVGYITKPVTDEKIANVINKIRKLLIKPPVTPKVQVNKVCVFSGGKIIPIDREEIALVYVKEKDVFVRTKSGEYATALNLQELESILIDSSHTNTKFFRVHRQYIVNLDKVLEIIPWFKGNYFLKMDDCAAQQVPISRNKVKMLKEIMGLK